MDHSGRHRAVLTCCCSCGRGSYSGRMLGAAAVQGVCGCCADSRYPRAEVLTLAISSKIFTAACTTSKPAYAVLLGCGQGDLVDAPELGESGAMRLYGRRVLVG